MTRGTLKNPPSSRVRSASGALASVSAMSSDGPTVSGRSVVCRAPGSRWAARRSYRSSLHLIGVVQNAAELAREEIELRRIELEVRQCCDCRHLLARQDGRHGKCYHAENRAGSHAPIRTPAVAGSWYPGTASALTRAIDGIWPRPIAIWPAIWLRSWRRTPD
jgi:hypothetical protein